MQPSASAWTFEKLLSQNANRFVLTRFIYAKKFFCKKYSVYFSFSASPRLIVAISPDRSCDMNLNYAIECGYRVVFVWMCVCVSEFMCECLHNKLYNPLLHLCYRSRTARIWIAHFAHANMCTFKFKYHYYDKRISDTLKIIQDSFRFGL